MSPAAIVRLLLTAAILVHNLQPIETTQPQVTCAPRFYGYGSFVCVCNATYCDTIAAAIVQPPGTYSVYTSTKDSDRLTPSNGQFTAAGRRRRSFFFPSSHDENSIRVYHSRSRQVITGFGGAFTDAAGMVLRGLSPDCAHHLLESYFSSDGLEYTLCRVPIGGTFSSARAYTYDDDHDNDFDLQHFALAQEDYNYKIPVIQAAQSMSRKPIKFVATPWSAPGWMKVNGKINGFGFLKPENGYYQTWANYFARFLSEYATHGVDFWAVTPQNEPTTGFIPFFPVNDMGFLPQWQHAFVNNNLGPTLEREGFAHVKILAVGDQRLFLLPYINQIVPKDGSNKYVDGAAIHWFTDGITPLSTLDTYHDEHPDLPLFMTEAFYMGFLRPVPPVQLGNWNRGMKYARRIVENMNHWVCGWIDWSLALDLRGGPSWADFFADACIIVNVTSDEFYKQPMYYAIGHFSKFVTPGSRVLQVQVSKEAASKGLSAVAFATPEKSTVLVTVNSDDNPVTTEIVLENDNSLEVDIPDNSIQTYIWWDD